MNEKNNLKELREIKKLLKYLVFSVSSFGFSIVMLLVIIATNLS